VVWFCMSTTGVKKCANNNTGRCQKSALISGSANMKVVFDAWRRKSIRRVTLALLIVFTSKYFIFVHVVKSLINY